MATNQEREEFVRANEEWHKARGLRFIAKLTTKFVGKKIVKIELTDARPRYLGRLSLEFEDGSTLVAGLGGDDADHCSVYLDVLVDEESLDDIV